MSIIISIVVIILSIAIDLITKAVVAGNMAVGQTIPIIKDVLHITYVKNVGAAFSMLEGKMTLFYIITPIALIIFIWYLIKNRKHSMFQNILLSLIIGGTIGNFIDRIIFQYVRDFIDVRLINFAVFNFADICLTIGVILFVIYLIIEIVKETKNKNNEGREKDN